MKGLEIYFSLTNIRFTSNFYATNFKPRWN